MPAQHYWLFKSEPSEFSIDDLAASPKQATTWTGIRNYRARNYLRDDVKLGEEAFFYHSSTDVIGIVGICRVSAEAKPDPTAFDKKSPYFDPKSKKESPTWVMVEVTFSKKFPVIIPLDLLRSTKGLEEMVVCQPGGRLSIQPVTPQEWAIVNRLAKKTKG